MKRTKIVRILVIVVVFFGILFVGINSPLLKNSRKFSYYDNLVNSGQNMVLMSEYLSGSNDNLDTSVFNYLEEIATKEAIKEINQYFNKNISVEKIPTALDVLEKSYGPQKTIIVFLNAFHLYVSNLAYSNPGIQTGAIQNKIKAIKMPEKVKETLVLYFENYFPYEENRHEKTDFLLAKNFLTEQKFNFFVTTWIVDYCYQEYGYCKYFLGSFVSDSLKRIIANKITDPFLIINLGLDNFISNDKKRNFVIKREDTPSDKMELIRGFYLDPKDFSFQQIIGDYDKELKDINSLISLGIINKETAINLLKNQTTSDLVKDYNPQDSEHNGHISRDSYYFMIIKSIKTYRDYILAYNYFKAENDEYKIDTKRFNDFLFLKYPMFEEKRIVDK